MKTLTTQQFIERASAVHAARYDYSECTYVNTDLVTDIICKTHGRFDQVAYNHLAGKGCRLCGRYHRRPRITTEQFIERARLVHGDRYNYSASVYIGSKSEIEIVCSVHGSFFQPAGSHLVGKGCKLCSGNQHPSNEAIIARFDAIHDAKYTYDSSTFVNCHSNIGVICKLHGPFQVSFTHHLKGVGCPRCSGHYQHKAGEQFVRRATERHDGKYDYSLARYVSAAKPVEIICPEHGSFFQGAGSHLQKHGCPHCGNEKKGLNNPGGYNEEFFDHYPEVAVQDGTLYLIRFSSLAETFLKIGVTKTNIDFRFKSGYSDFDIAILRTQSLPLRPAFHLEQAILYAFKEFRYTPMQTTFPGKTECLSISCEEIIVDIWPSVQGIYEEVYGPMSNQDADIIEVAIDARPEQMCAA